MPQTASAAMPSRPGRPRPSAWLGAGGLAEQQGDRDGVLAKVAAGRPLGRLAEPAEIASVIVFLLLRSGRRTSPAPRGAPTAGLSPIDHLAWLHARADRERRRRLRIAGARASRRSRSSSLAVRSYETRGRARPEEECSVRTPFQRDRDRILHSKPFRRLKGKTQVFIDPAGDHYRTRMTHTLETTGIARVVARALRLNEDLTEAIGLGHDSAIRPFGHAGEAALDDLRRRRLPPQRAVGADRDTAEPDARGRRRDPHAHRAAGARDARGKDRAHRRPRRLHQPRHRRRDPLRDPDRGRSPGGRDRDPRSDRGRSASTRSSTTSSRHSARAGDIVQSDDVGAAMLSLRAFMFERVYLGPATMPEHERAREMIGRIYDHLAAEGRDADEIVEFIAGMTDRFALSYAERARRWRGSRTRPSRRSRQPPTSSTSSRHGRSSGKAAAAVTWDAARSTRSGRRRSRSTPSTSSTTASAAARRAT